MDCVGEPNRRKVCLVSEWARVFHQNISSMAIYKIIQVKISIEWGYKFTLQLTQLDIAVNTLHCLVGQYFFGCCRRVVFGGLLDEKWKSERDRKKN